MPTAVSPVAHSGNGGALIIGDTATVNITNSSISINTNQGCCGGGLAAFGSAALLLQDVTLQGNNVPSRQGGAVYLNEKSSLTASGCLLQGNHADEGGAVFTKGAAHSVINNSRFFDNTAKIGGAINVQDRTYTQLQSVFIADNSAALSGGGIAAYGRAALQLSNTSITRNSARFGGGAMLSSGNFSVAQLQSSVYDNTAAYSPNLGVSTLRIELLGNASVSGFVSRLGSDAGLLPVTLNVTGLHELPCEVDVAAQLAGANIMVNRSGSDGLVTMNLKLRQPPGLYELQFRVLNTAGVDSDVPPANMSIEVVPCPLGDVTAAADACLTCPVGYYRWVPKGLVCWITASLIQTSSW
jgi:predicted outer membrane repeat protein